MAAREEARALEKLAGLHGIRTAHVDAMRGKVRVSRDSLLAVLRLLGAPVETLRDAPSALRERVQAHWRRRCEPVSVIRNGGPGSLAVRVPAAPADLRASGRLRLETGEEMTLAWRLADHPAAEIAEVEGTAYVARVLPLPAGLPWGYHRLILDIRDDLSETHVISAPVEAYTPPDGGSPKWWGVFIPLYALHSRKSWGSGDFSDVAALAEWVHSLGGASVGTLPILAVFLDKPFNPSPYAPASRLFWNEFFLDVARIPELGLCPPAQAFLESREFRDGIRAQQEATFIDYARIMELKRRVLVELAKTFFAGASMRQDAFREFLASRPALEDYAAFRAAGEREGASWHVWPEPKKSGLLRPGDYDEEVRRYHLYAQWVAHNQVQALADKVRERGMSLLLDMPLGVNPDGYDVWRFRERFVLGASVGAPPDVYSTKGQDWGFPPLHPERIREDGYRYLRDCLRHQFALAGILRIDHVMGFHRLFFIPQGAAIQDGAYVDYRSDEIYAVLALESNRFRAMIVGEDLGTVSPDVRPAMARHRLHRMFVVQEPSATGGRTVLRPTSADFLASLNTHDTSTFAAFWEEKDIQDRLEAGLVDGVGAQGDREKRLELKEKYLRILRDGFFLKGDPSEPRDVLRALLAYLAAGPARLLQINLEDLWLEKEPQNIPSVSDRWPSWRRRARYALEDFAGSPEVLETLTEVDRLRRRTPE